MSDSVLRDKYTAMNKIEEALDLNVFIISSGDSW